jgi:spore coat polysaccharide biosynthesis predicted glycosyltransferase SpsG
VLHADVGRESGWGHLRECLTLGSALRARDVEPAFIIPTRESGAARVLRSEGYRFSALPRSWWQGRHGASLDRVFEPATDAVIVADLVTVTAQYARAAAKSTAGLAVITEHVDEERGAVNFNISRFPELMPLHEVYQRPARRRIRDSVGRLLVCFGGSDPKNCTGLTLEMLRQGFERSVLPRGIHIDVVCGPLFEHGSAIRAMAASYPVPMSVVGPLTPGMLVRRAHASDLAITTGGGTMYEFCATGLPSIVVPVLDKMAANAAVLARRGAVVVTPRADCLSSEDLLEAVRRLLARSARRRFAVAARRTVDGGGADRMAARLVRKWRLA